jgi:hypothetical protein
MRQTYPLAQPTIASEGSSVLQHGICRTEAKGAKKMTIHLTRRPKAQSQNHPCNETAAFLAKAKNGELPAVALENIRLDRGEVSRFLSRELLLWSSAAEGAKMHLVSTLFNELHKSLNENAKHQRTHN